MFDFLLHAVTVTAIYALIALVWVGSTRYLARWILLQSNSSTESEK